MSECPNSPFLTQLLVPYLRWLVTSQSYPSRFVPFLPLLLFSLLLLFAGRAPGRITLIGISWCSKLVRCQRQSFLPYLFHCLFDDSFGFLGDLRGLPVCLHSSCAFNVFFSVSISFLCKFSTRNIVYSSFLAFFNALNALLYVFEVFFYKI